MYLLGLLMKNKRRGENFQEFFFILKLNRNQNALVILVLILSTSMNIPRQSQLEKVGISNTSPFPNLEPSFCQQK